MKRIIASIILLALCAMTFISCKDQGVGGGSDEQLTAAKDYLYSMYKNEAEVTPSDFTRVGVLSISDASYTVEWAAEISSGASDAVKIVPGTDGTVTVDVIDKAETDVVYKLTATIKDAEGKSIQISFNHKVPMFKEFSWSEYVAAADEETIVIKGVVTAIMAKSKGNSYNCLYLQDNDGGYYVYNMATDPVTDDKIEIGMTVRVSGTRATYSGTYEVMNAVVEIVDSNKVQPAAVDFTEKFTKAESLKDTALTAQQGMLVTVKGVEITGEDVSNGYYKFKLGELESYVRISSSVCPLIKDEQSKLTEGHASHLGWIANVTGVICVYDGAFYLTPVSADAFEYVSLPAKDDAGMVAFEKDSLTLPAAITDDTVITLNTAGQSYSQVQISWESDNACAVVADGKLAVKLPDEEAKVKITATVKCGSVTETKVFDITVDAVPKNVYTTKIVDKPVAAIAYKFALEQVSLTKTLYFAGAMSGNYFATTDKADKATDVYIEDVTGGFRLYFLDGTTKTYLDIYEYTAGKVGVQLTTTPVAVYTWDATLNILVANVIGADYYLGTYKTYDTISASKTTYITGENAANVGVSQFVAQLVTLDVVK